MATQDQHQVPYSLQFKRNVFQAARNGDVTILKDLLKDKPQEEVLRLVSVKTSKGATPLILGCLGIGERETHFNRYYYEHLFGNWEVVDYLVNKCGVSVE